VPALHPLPVLSDRPAMPALLPIPAVWAVPAHDLSVCEAIGSGEIFLKGGGEINGRESEIGGGSGTVIPDSRPGVLMQPAVAVSVYVGTGVSEVNDPAAGVVAAMSGEVSEPLPSALASGAGACVEPAATRYLYVVYQDRAGLMLAICHASHPVIPFQKGGVWYIYVVIHDRAMCLYAWPSIVSRHSLAFPSIRHCFCIDPGIYVCVICTRSELQEKPLCVSYVRAAQEQSQWGWSSAQANGTCAAGLARAPEAAASGWEEPTELARVPGQVGHAVAMRVPGQVGHAAAHASREQVAQSGSACEPGASGSERQRVRAGSKWLRAAARVD